MTGTKVATTNEADASEDGREPVRETRLAPVKPMGRFGTPRFAMGDPVEQTLPGGGVRLIPGTGERDVSRT